MTTAATEGTLPSGNPMKRVLALRDFRLLFAGATTSLLGDQFALIATPWLVLQLTGDPLALGIVLALAVDPVDFQKIVACHDLISLKGS